ncbi:MAG: phage terminase large subunit family protein [Planctomycetota bacterium]
MKPPPKLTVSEWADTYRKLSPEASAEPGQWRTSRAPFQRGIMDAYNLKGIHTLVVMKSAQVGATEIINNIVGYIISENPGPILLLQPTLDMADAWSKDRLAPMLRDTPKLQDTVKDPRSRDSGNTLKHKIFPGGHITMAGANSPASLASRPIRDVLCDEVDRYPVSAGTEGDPVNLARKRSTTFPTRKLILTSTPTVKGASRIEAAYEKSSQGRYFVPCPHCGEYQVLKWSNVQWEEAKPATENKSAVKAVPAYYVCDIHGCVIEEKSKSKMVAKGEWRFVVDEPLPGEDPVYVSGIHHRRGVIGFHINELYSSWRTWNDVKIEFLAEKDSPETLKTWVNTTLGETFEDEGATTDPHALYQRREDYTGVPNEVKVLTIGVDVQGDRLEYEIVGWGVGKENWSIKYGILLGDPDHAEVWAELTTVLKADYFNDDGFPLHISCGCIDSGYSTQNVYNYCKTRPIDRFYAIKGMDGEGRPIVNPRDVIGYPHKRQVIIVGVDTAKATMLGSLNQIEIGEGYSHFPMMYDEEFFNQLTAEKLVTKFIRGFPRREWVKTRARNEACDNRAYNYAALGLLNPDLTMPAQAAPQRRQPKSNHIANQRVSGRRQTGWMKKK